MPAPDASSSPMNMVLTTSVPLPVGEMAFIVTRAVRHRTGTRAMGPARREAAASGPLPRGLPARPPVRRGRATDVVSIPGQDRWPPAVTDHVAAGLPACDLMIRCHTSPMNRRRPGLAATALPLVLVLALAGCDLAALLEPTPTPFGDTPAPTQPPAATTTTPTEASPTPTPTETGPAPLPTPEQYVVQRGDTLTSIARRYGISVAQLLAANPQVQDPNTIRFGYALTVPPRDSLAVMYRGGGGMIDPDGDTLDLDGQLVQAPGYADLIRFTARFQSGDLVVELDAISVPPPLDPDGEVLRYVIEVDGSGDLEPDFQAVASNDLTDPATPEGPPFGLSLLDRRSNTTSRTPNVPGSVVTVENRLVVRLSLAALGDPGQVAVAAFAQRDFYPEGRASPDSVESTVDRVPDQQWPRANPRWLLITRAL